MKSVAETVREVLEVLGDYRLVHHDVKSHEPSWRIERVRR